MKSMNNERQITRKEKKRKKKDIINERKKKEGKEIGVGTVSKGRN